MANTHTNKRRRFTDDEISIIKQYYPIGGYKLVQKYLPDRTEKVIQQKAYNLGVKSSFRFTEEEDEMIKMHYPVGGWEEVNKHIPHKNKSQIQSRAFALDVKVLSYNDRYFEIIDTEDKAYWLGFVYADGYVTESQKRFGVELQIADKPHLVKLNKAMDSNIRIRERKRVAFDNIPTHSCSILYRNNNLYNDLFNKGVTKTKTYDIKFPTSDIVSYKYLHHFLRGVFDGNGTLSLHKNGDYLKPEISLISANKEYLESIVEYFNNFNINFSLLKMTRNKYSKVDMYTIRLYKQKEIERFVKKIYFDSEESVRLDRKYNTAIEIYDFINKC